jgi:transcriptional regulator with XRE-family HTH domain
LQPRQIKDIRSRLGLTQSQISVLTGGKPDSALWRKYENGTRPLPQMKGLILSELAAGVPEFTINTDPEDAMHWIEHTRFPRMKWAVDYVDEGERLTPVSMPPENYQGDYDLLVKRAWTAWEVFHQVGLDEEIE